MKIHQKKVDKNFAKLNSIKLQTFKNYKPIFHNTYGIEKIKKLCKLISFNNLQGLYNVRLYRLLHKRYRELKSLQSKRLTKKLAKHSNPLCYKGYRQ